MLLFLLHFGTTGFHCGDFFFTGLEIYVRICTIKSMKYVCFSIGSIFNWKPFNVLTTRYCVLDPNSVKSSFTHLQIISRGISRVVHFHCVSDVYSGLLSMKMCSKIKGSRPLKPSFWWAQLHCNAISLKWVAHYLVLLVFSGFYWVILGFTGFYLTLLGFTGLYPAKRRNKRARSVLSRNNSVNLGTHYIQSCQIAILRTAVDCDSIS